MKSKKKKCVKVHYISDGDNLQTIIDLLKSEGVSDLSTVHVTMNGFYPSCDCDGYCYCSMTYDDIGFEYTKEE